MKNNPQQSSHENKMGVMPIGPLLAGMAVPMILATKMLSTML